MTVVFVDAALLFWKYTSIVGITHTSSILKEPANRLMLGLWLNISAKRLLSDAKSGAA